MKLLFLEGDRGLFAVRPFEPICFPTAGGNITKPGLYECEIVTEKEKFTFVEGVPVETVKVDDLYDTEIMDELFKDNHHNILDYFGCDFSPNFICKKIGGSYIYKEVSTGLYVYYQKNPNLEGHVTRYELYPEMLEESIVVRFPKRNFRIVMNGAFSDKTELQHKGSQFNMKESFIWHALEKTAVDITASKDTTMAFAATIIGSLSSYERSELTDLQITIYNGKICKLAYSWRYTGNIPMSGEHTKYFIVCRYKNMIKPISIQYCAALMPYIESSISSASKHDITILSLSEIKEWMYKNMVFADYDSQKGSTHHIQYQSPELITIPVNVNAFNERISLQVISSLKLFYRLVDFEELGLPEDMKNKSKEEFMNTLQKEIAIINSDFNSTKKRFGKNVNKRTISEIRKLSYDKILGLG